MGLISYFKKIKQKHDEIELQKVMARLRKSGFHTIRLDEKMKVSFISEKKAIEFDDFKEAKDKKKAFVSFVETLDRIFGRHDEFEIDGCKVVFWKI